MTEEEAKIKRCFNCKKWIESEEIEKSDLIPGKWGRCKNLYATHEQTTCDEWIEK